MGAAPAAGGRGACTGTARGTAGAARDRCRRGPPARRRRPAAGGAGAGCTGRRARSAAGCQADPARRRRRHGGLDPAGAAPAGRAAGFAGGETLFAGCPPAVGGALAPSSGAFGVVTFGRCAGIPGGGGLRLLPACCWARRRRRALRVVRLPEGVDGEGGVTLDISNPRCVRRARPARSSGRRLTAS